MLRLPLSHIESLLIKYNLINGFHRAKQDFLEANEYYNDLPLQVFISKCNTNVEDDSYYVMWLDLIKWNPVGDVRTINITPQYDKKGFPYYMYFNNKHELNYHSSKNEELTFRFSFFLESYITNLYSYRGTSYEQWILEYTCILITLYKMKRNCFTVYDLISSHYVKTQLNEVETVKTNLLSCLNLHISNYPVDGQALLVLPS